MRATPFALTSCAFVLGLTLGTDVRADAVKVTPELTVFAKDEARPADGLPTVLRGRATRRGTVDGRFGGRILAPIGGEILICDARRTDCFHDQAPHGVYE